MSQARTCGEATMQLLKDYGVDTVFGIPGDHNLELYRGIATSNIRHVLARNEQGAGFMADGYGRSTGRPGVCTIISGPGVTNALTAIGQAFADSVPMLVISSANDVASQGKGWSCLHDTPDQQAITESLTALSAMVYKPEEIPELIARAFAIFHSQRPRPVHISIPIDVLRMTVDEPWIVSTVPSRPIPAVQPMTDAADMLTAAERPLMLVGGGASEAGENVTKLAELLNAGVIASNAGKGVVSDSNPLSLSGSFISPAVQDYMSKADVILSIGCEIAESDSFIERMPINGKMIKIDIDPARFHDLYPADIAILGNAKEGVDGIYAALQERGFNGSGRDSVAEIVNVRKAMFEAFTSVENQHVKVLTSLRKVLPEDTIMMGDICQVVYTGSPAMPIYQPRTWFYPAAFATLGCALPDAIGAKVALPERPVIAMVGDGGFMFTLQELATAVEEELSIPIVLWNNDSLAMIRDIMDIRGIPQISVNQRNPDFLKLADAFGCPGIKVNSTAELEKTITEALSYKGPTLILVQENDDWLQE
ncbi:MAG: 5-guanidino-2-oxopentanoate decarboxylase [Rhodospirillales bacterium]|jgi:5-guanidino-2-oxopentanoate decarboxylase|nr:5-guanidino-2-oxopentanoate decarboxylase [Rhodospirillales bacterium]